MAPDHRSARGLEARLGTKRQFVDIAQGATGRKAPEPSKGNPKKTKGKLAAPALTAVELERRRKLERREVYADQRHAAQLLWSADTTGRPGGVTLCGWTLIAKRDEVEVVRQTAPDKAPRAHLAGLQKCGLGWICPVCTRAKSEDARQKLNALLSRGRREGWVMVMMTLTVRHDEDMPLAWLWQRVSQASDELRRNHHWTRVLNPSLVGSVKAVEITHGENGWHPHYHVVLAFRPGEVADEAEAIARVEVLRAAWMREIAAQGLTGNEHAFAVQGAAAAGNYLAKWGAAEELSLGHAKSGRRGQRTPWQLLRASRDGDQEASALWLDFVRVIKGTHQIRMTPGLRAMVKEELERLDAERPVREEPKDVTLDRIERGEWMDTGRRRRVRLLEAAEARTRREAEREVWEVRHGIGTDRDLTDLVVIDDEDGPPQARPDHDEPELRLEAIRRDRAEKRGRQRREVLADLDRLDDMEGL